MKTLAISRNRNNLFWASKSKAITKRPACIGLFAAVVATWIAVSGPGVAALVAASSVGLFFVVRRARA